MSGFVFRNLLGVHGFGFTAQGFSVFATLNPKPLNPKPKKPCSLGVKTY